MFEAVWSYILQNQFLVGGLGTVIFGSLMYLARTVPMTIYTRIKSSFMSSLTVFDHESHYTQAVRVLTQYGFQSWNRSYTIRKDGQLDAGFGSFWAIYRGRVLRYSRILVEDKMKRYEKLTIVLFSRNKSLVESLSKEMIARPDDGTIQIAKLKYGGWDHIGTKTKRPISSVMTNSDIRERIVSKVETFLNSKQAYIDKGLVYKLVILLYGPPGTGKTSLVAAIASHFNLDLGIINSMSEVDGMECNPHMIVVIEDIDRLVHPTKTKQSQDNEAEDDREVDVRKAYDEKHTHTLLNTLDGISTPEGMIMFITTNHIDRIDPAILRSSRVDMRVEIPALDHVAMAELIYRFDPEINRSEVAKQLVGRSMTGAELQELLIQHPSSTVIERILSA